eukprot:TRINITY_DN56134_c0_g2_i1.p1 TRINITY_DN56134_c0_g2~~TRINITY_DN56134_c0_g2_i1.p1  ORF type:complete len:156 (+),score=33.33 TRINITY_DN56134_c0_g2_i1:83-550(+)
MFCFFFFKQKTAYEMLRSLVGSEMCIRDRCDISLGKISTIPTYKNVPAAVLSATPSITSSARNPMPIKIPTAFMEQAIVTAVQNRKLDTWAFTSPTANANPAMVLCAATAINVVRKLPVVCEVPRARPSNTPWIDSATTIVYAPIADTWATSKWL